LVLPPVGLGAATTGAGADVVVTGAGAECVVTGAALVVAVEEVAAAGFALCAVAFLWVTLWAAFLALAVVV
jgi:hypothetical protein